MSLARSVSIPYYFVKPDGTPVYLTGSHTWNNLQDEGSTFPPAPFDYTGYVNWMDNNEFNFMRLWYAEIPYEATSSGWHYPSPYSRPGPGNAADGRLKFNVNTFDQTYFDRLRARVIEAGQHGIYVGIMLFQGWSLNSKGTSSNPWPYHPFNINNNINSINGDPSSTGTGNLIHTTSEPAAILTLQQTYIRKVVDTVNDLDNVLYEISNESEANSTQWQYNMINYIKTYEAGKPKLHPVGMTAQFPGGSNSDLFSSPADWISPNLGGGYGDTPPTNNGSKIILTDTDHLFGIGGDTIWVWKSFMRGLNPICMDDLGQTGVNTGGLSPNSTFAAAEVSSRTGMTQTAMYAARIDLTKVVENGALSSTGYMLADLGTQYLAFAPNGGSLILNLSAAATTSNFSVEWFNITTNTASTAVNVAGGSTAQPFVPPFGGPAALLLNKLASQPPVTGPYTQTIGTGPDSLVLQISQDEYNGPVQYVIFVGSTQFGDTLTVHASHGAGLHDTITVQGSFGTGNLRFDLRMVNDASDGVAWWLLSPPSPVGHRRDLYCDGASYNGVNIPNSTLTIMDDGYHGVDFVGSVAPPVDPPPVTPPGGPTNAELLAFGESHPTKVDDIKMTFTGGNIAVEMDVEFDPDAAGPLPEQLYPATVYPAASQDLAFAKDYINQSYVSLASIQTGSTTTTMTFLNQTAGPVLPPPTGPTNQELLIFAEANPGKVNVIKLTITGNDIAMDVFVLFYADVGGPNAQQVYHATVDPTSAADLTFAETYINRDDVSLTTIQLNSSSSTLTFAMQGQVPPSVIVSTVLAFAPAQGSYIAPVPAGTLIGQLQVTPADWTGSMSLSGSDASSFTVDSSRNVSTSQQLTVARDYSVTFTANP